MIPIYIPACIFCKHMYRGEKTLCCNAYPGGIPDDIRTEQVDPRELLECGNGYKFEDKRKAPT